MKHYSIEARVPIFVKEYGFLPFSKNNVKNLSKILCGKWSHVNGEFLNHVKNMLHMHIKNYFKTSNHETAEATGSVIGNKISNKKPSIAGQSLLKNHKRPE